MAWGLAAVLCAGAVGEGAASALTVQVGVPGVGGVEATLPGVTGPTVTAWSLPLRCRRPRCRRSHAAAGAGPAAASGSDPGAV